MNLIAKAIEEIAPEKFAALMVTLFGLVVLLVFFLVALYIYSAFAWMTIAKKLNYKKPWLAWIPIANFFLIPILAKKHWAWGFMFLVPIANLVFGIIWTWKIFERRNYPGALSLITVGIFIPFISFFAFVACLVIIGLVAWKDRKIKRKKLK